MKYKFKEAFKIWISCHTVKDKKITRLELVAFSFIFYLVIPVVIFTWWIPVIRIMRKGVKNKNHYLYFKRKPIIKAINKNQLKYEKKKESEKPNKKRKTRKTNKKN